MRGRTSVLDGFVLKNVPNTSFYLGVTNYASLPSTQGYLTQIRNVVVSRIFATWNSGVSGASGMAIQGSARDVAIEDCIIDTSAISESFAYSNCFIRANSGETEEVAIRRCTFIQKAGSGNVFDVQGNSSSINTGTAHTRSLHEVAFEDCIFDSSSSSVQVGGSGGGWVDDTDSTSGASGYVYNVEFRRCSFINVGIKFQSLGNKPGYLRFTDGSLPGSYSNAPLLGRGPDDVGVNFSGSVSNATFTNNNGYDEDWIVSGGTPAGSGTANISINGVSTGTYNGVYRVRTGDQITFAGFSTTGYPTVYRQSR